MTAPVFLLLFAVAGSYAARPLLARTAWLQRSPQWGVRVWQALSLAVASAIVLAGVTLAVPALPVGSGLAWFLDTAPFGVAEHYTTPAGLSLAVASAGATGALLVRIVVLLVVQLRRDSRLRSDQLDRLGLVGEPHPGGFVLVAHHEPLVYCLPGRRSAVVVTSAALDLLGERDLRLVLAHERAHLRARHHLAVASSVALARAFRGVGVFATAHEQICTLVEMQADDSARAAGDRRALARALVTLCSGAVPPAALAAADTAALARVRRLAGSSRGPLPPRQGLLVALTTVVLLAAPAVLAAAPALEAMITNCWVGARHA